MELAFDGYRLAESDGQGVKFIGCYLDAENQEHFIVCRVTRLALESLVMQDLNTATKLVAAYSCESIKINQIAADQFGSAVKKPEVTGL